MPCRAAGRRVSCIGTAPPRTARRPARSDAALLHQPAALNEVWACAWGGVVERAGSHLHTTTGEDQLAGVVKLHNLAYVCVRLGDHERARALFAESLERADEAGYDRVAASNRMYIAYLDGMEGGGGRARAAEGAHRAGGGAGLLARRAAGPLGGGDAAEERAQRRARAARVRGPPGAVGAARGSAAGEGRARVARPRGAVRGRGGW
ncbi:uncharacterized protein SOCE836_083120 [Sorangium cellulosum]|uniref:Uncharacterized protein n=1 Tax=Sorangium cellulosum TaxID=56 RepID=A0A4P2R0H5_SORCE|nr:uncharacterized protein SOCE836_083120 [Sorangium cellulosum]